MDVLNLFSDCTMTDDAELQTYISALFSLSDDEVVARHFGFRCTRRDINSINANHWLNAQVVNLYFQLIQTSCPWMSVVDAFFMSAVREKRQPEKYFNLSHLKKDKVLVPVIHGITGH